MGISDLIAEFIGETLDGADGQMELQRGEIANRFNCVPSQVSYVISTRFSPEHGYIVESRRGGGGYIKIRRVQADPRQLIMHTVNAIGDRIDFRTAGAFLSNLFAAGILDEKTLLLISSAVGESALRQVPRDFRDLARASIIKQILINL